MSTALIAINDAAPFDVKTLFYNEVQNLGCHKFWQWVKLLTIFSWIGLSHCFQFLNVNVVVSYSDLMNSKSCLRTNDSSLFAFRGSRFCIKKKEEKGDGVKNDGWILYLESFSRITLIHTFNRQTWKPF